MNKEQVAPHTTPLQSRTNEPASNQKAAAPSLEHGDARTNALQGVIDELAAGDDVHAAALIGRDGIPVLVRFNVPCNEEAVCAMGAAIIGAADAAIGDMTTQEVERFSAESTGHRYLGVCLNPELAILMMAKNTTSAEVTYRQLDAAVKAIQEILAGR